MKFIKKKIQTQEKDELHKEYGIFRNCIYILGSIRKYRKSLLWLMLLGIITTATNQYLWSFIGKFIIDIVQQQAASPDKSLTPLITLLCITVAIDLISNELCTLANNRIWFNMIYVRMKLIGERIAKSLSMNYETLEDPKMLDREGKARQATGGDGNGVEGLMHSIYSLMTQVLLIAATVTVLSTLNLWLVLIIFILLIFQYFAFVYTVKKDKRETWDKLAPTWRKINYMEQTTQDFSYAKDIRLFGMKNWLSKKQHEILSEKYIRMKNSRNFWTYNSIFAHGISLLRNAVTYGFLIYSVVFKELSIGNFTLYLTTAATFSSTLTELLNSLGQLKQRSLEVDDFRSYLEIENPDAGIETVPLLQTTEYTFQFENVSFKYKGQESYAIKNLNLTLNPGERLAVVGLNGAGKTTFIKLLLRLYDVTEGRILLNGTDIRSFDRTEYYKLFAPVFQNVEIFAFPMSENVSMKSPQETDCDKAEDVLRQAGMGEKLETLPEGVHTQLLKVIYDNGIDLSGGEKQKLALARALYKDAPIVVLDEPTAALDALAEYQLYKNFDSITKSKSAVYISHRLSSTRFCDHVAMFQSGEMIEYGSHDELLARGGAYARMFEVQAEYYKNNEKEEAAVNV